MGGFKRSEKDRFLKPEKEQGRVGESVSSSVGEGEEQSFCTTVSDWREKKEAEGEEGWDEGIFLFAM